MTEEERVMVSDAVVDIFAAADASHEDSCVILEKLVASVYIINWYDWNKGHPTLEQLTGMFANMTVKLLEAAAVLVDENRRMN